MSPDAGLRVEYLPLGAQQPAQPGSVLGIAAFSGHESGRTAEQSLPWIAIRTPVLLGPEPVHEVWRGSGPMQSGDRGLLHYRHDGQTLFGCVQRAEDPPVRGVTAQAGAAASTDSPRTAFYATTEAVYRDIFDTLDELGFPNLLRMWNYLADINVNTHGLERYRQFNSARRAALLASGQMTSGNVPAACALGSLPGSPLAVYFLASRLSPVVVENPRQISAYDYPSQYGPKPAFSRASTLTSANGSLLFISGTASIVGHETRHMGDVAAQTRETLLNIESLLEEANRQVGRPGFDIRTLAFKVYVRHPHELPTVRAQLESALGPQARLLYLQADVCREELLVEIEAVGQCPA